MTIETRGCEPGGREEEEMNEEIRVDCNVMQLYGDEKFDIIDSFNLPISFGFVQEGSNYVFKDFDIYSVFNQDDRCVYFAYDIA